MWRSKRWSQDLCWILHFPSLQCRSLRLLNRHNHHRHHRHHRHHDRHHDPGQHNQRRSPRLHSKRTQGILPVMETSLHGTSAQLEARLLRWQEINQPKWTANIKENGKYKNKAQRTRGLLSGYQSNILRSYHKLLKSWSYFIFISSNFNQISAFRLDFNFKILTKCSFTISTKNNL